MTEFQLNKLKKNYLPGNTLVILLKKFGVKYSSKTINEFKESALYPNILAFKEILTNFSIESAGGKIKFSDLETIPSPFLLHLKIHGGVFLPIHKVTASSVEVLTKNQNMLKLNRNDIEAMASGYILAFDSSNKQDENALFLNKLNDIITILLSVGYGVYIIISLLIGNNYNRISPT